MNYLLNHTHDYISKGLGKIFNLKIKRMDAEKQPPALDVNATDAVSESNVDEFIEILDQHRKKCEKEGKYVEA